MKPLGADFVHLCAMRYLSFQKACKGNKFENRCMYYKEFVSRGLFIISGLLKFVVVLKIVLHNEMLFSR